MSDKPFFIGWAGIGRGFVLPLAIIAAGLTLGFGAMSWALGLTQPDPGPAAGMGRQTVTGVVEARPYPILHVTEGTDAVLTGETVMLASVNGKRGVQAQAQGLHGQLVTASGGLLQRGDLQMLQLRGGTNGMAAAEGAAPEIPVEPLGRWRIAGEICDGKCLAGAMRPGTGLAHRACANLCLIGGAPPIFVSSAPVEGEEFLLITTEDGDDTALRDLTALYISVEGDLERRGTALVFTVALGSVEVLP